MPLGCTPGPCSALTSRVDRGLLHESQHLLSYSISARSTGRCVQGIQVPAIITHLLGKPGLRYMLDVVEEYSSFPHLSLEEFKLVPCHFQLVLFRSFSASTPTLLYLFQPEHIPWQIGSPLRSRFTKWDRSTASHEFKNGMSEQVWARERLPLPTTIHHV